MKRKPIDDTSPPNPTIFTGFRILVDEDERVRMYAYIKQMSISKAYRTLIHDILPDKVPTKEEAINSIIERLKLDWKVALYDNPFVTKKSFCTSRTFMLRKGLTDNLANIIMKRFEEEFDFEDEKDK